MLMASSCIVQDPQTKRHRPRNYLEMLEGRVASLEGRDPKTPSNSTPSPFAAAASNDSNAQSNPYDTPERGGDGASDLSSRVGMLDFRTAQMEPQYLGSSSAFAFSRIINFSLRRDLPVEPSLASLNDKFGSSPSPSPCLLPDYHVAVRLSNAYFKHIHPQYPFLHEPTFREWEAILYDSARDFTDIGFHTSPLFFLNMVYAVAALLQSNTQSLAEQLYMTAQLYTDVLSKDNLESIQALLCYAMYSLRSLTGPSLWKLSGLALRQCIELGYHRGIKRLAPTANPLQQEMRKRVFWVAQGIDCTVALRLGRPLGIPLQEIDAQFPSDVDDSSITEVGISSPCRTEIAQPSTTMSTAIHVFKLRHIWARIHTSLFSDTSHFSVESDAYHAQVVKLRADLDDWLATAPPSRQRTNEDLSIFSIRAWYEMNYSYTILLHYRGQIAEYKESSGHIFEECIQASRNICQGYRRLYIGTAVRYTWGTLHCLFLAGLTYLHCLWTSPTACESVRPDDVSKTCTDCTMVLVAIAEGWQGAAPYRDTFEALASRTVAMVMNKNPEMSPPLPPPGSLEVEGQPSWTDWINDIAEAGVLDGVDGLLAGFINDFTAHGDC
ncbi:fungal-specific transcription factor domain-containing protein [Dactylonectria estremocensis]|uniref:Fungal-specific transcription factor domain-containing protein n=1 Tax=Dactylonectria estremocensis TaxID=1079267 RepID=A0A9P9E3D0_9HYPO|nr:fungal-specific transcription factor domain-containing protein [Dactylonectria estremocensis]